MRAFLRLFILVLGLSLLWAQPASAIQLLIKKGAATPIPFAEFDASTGQTAVTGQTGAAVGTPVALVAGVGGNITVSIHQAGGSGFAAATGSVVEMGNGTYYYIPVAGDTSGATSADSILLTSISCPGCQGYSGSAQVVAFDPLSASNLGLSALPTVAAGANGGLPTGNGSGQVQLQPNQVVTVSPTDTNVPASVWNALTGSYNSAGTFGFSLGYVGTINLTTGLVNLNLNQALSTAITGDFVGGALIGARSQAFGKWVLSGSTLTLYAADGTTSLKAFTISPTPATPSSRQ